MARYEQLTIGELFVESIKGMRSGVTPGNLSVVPFMHKETLADDAEFDLPNAVEGFALVTDGTEYIIGHVGTDGAVLDIVTSTNAVAADTDANLCLYDNGTKASVKNRLGSEKTVTCLFFYAG